MAGSTDLSFFRLEDIILPFSLDIDSQTPRASDWVSTVGEVWGVSTPYVEPGFDESCSAEYQSISTYGRHEPIRAYSGASGTIVSVSPIFVADSQDDIEGVRKKALWLKALTLPWVGSDDAHRPPPAVILKIGNISLRGVVQNCAISWGGPHGTPQGDRLDPHMARVSLTILSSSSGYDRPSLDYSRYMQVPTGMTSVSGSSYSQASTTGDYSQSGMARMTP